MLSAACAFLCVLLTSLVIQTQPHIERLMTRSSIQVISYSGPLPSIMRPFNTLQATFSALLLKSYYAQSHSNLSTADLGRHTKHRSSLSIKHIFAEIARAFILKYNNLSLVAHYVGPNLILAIAILVYERDRQATAARIEGLRGLKYDLKGA